MSAEEQRTGFPDDKRSEFDFVVSADNIKESKREAIQGIGDFANLCLFRSYRVASLDNGDVLEFNQLDGTHVTLPNPDHKYFVFRMKHV